MKIYSNKDDGEEAVVATFDSEIAALQAKSLLDAENIPSYINSTRYAGTALPLAGGIHIKVPRHFAKTAHYLLHEIGSEDE